ncbi:MAG: Hsp20/alpha crystallin family protein [Anaerolineae bacterium]
MAFNFSESHGSSDRLQVELDRLKRDPFDTGRWVSWQHTHTWRPPTDVYETDESVIVRVEIAGMREADFNVTLHDQLLVISGARTDPSPKVVYHQLEVRYGEFRTEVYLHWAVEPGSIAATYQDGFLVVELPKARARRVTVIEVNNGL